MDPRCDLENVRRVLMRLEESIIFSCIERAQFLLNPKVYRPGSLGETLGTESLFGNLLYDCERSHARVGRYLSPDENPFYNELPDAVLPSRYDVGPLSECRINMNGQLRSVYENEMLPLLCAAGDDGEYGSSAVCDVQCVQNLSRRVHYGKFVAESKWHKNRARLEPLAEAGDAEALLREITDQDVERAVLSRVSAKTRVYGREPAADGREAIVWIEPDVIRSVYERWIIPMNKQVQVAYLLQRVKRS